MWFLILHIDPLRDGEYPPDPQGSSYTGPAVRSQPRQSAPFEKPAQLAAEVDARLKKCRIEGKLLEEEIKNGKEWDELTRWSKRALNYVSGYRRRRTGYRQWCASFHFRHKEMK